MGVLPERLAELHRESVRFNAAVRAIHRHEEGGFFIEIDAESVRVQEVILTLPAHEAANILRPLSPDSSERLSQLRYNPLAVVHLLLPEGEPLPDIGSGFKTTLHDPHLTRGVTSHGGLFGPGSGRDNLYTAFLGGMGREEVMGMSEETLFAIATSDFRRVTKSNPIPLALHRTWMPAWDRSWRSLDGLRLPPGIHLCSAFSGRPGIPGRLEEAQQVVTRIQSTLDS
jgi:oxygen-dependent protoporphyrinogen oxidase